MSPTIRPSPAPATDREIIPIGVQAVGVRVPFAAQAIDPTHTQIAFGVDVTEHLDPGTAWTLTTEISRDDGQTWVDGPGCTRAIGGPAVGLDGLPTTTAGLTVTLDPPMPDLQIRGAFTITKGAPLRTSLRFRTS